MNTIRYGLKNCYYCVKGEETPKRLPGAVNLSLTADIDVITKKTATGIEFPIAVNDNGYDGSLEIATIPETFASDILGIYRDENNVLCRRKQQLKMFALLFEISGTEKIRYSLQNCYCIIPDLESSTIADKPEVNTSKINIKVIPCPCDTEKAIIKQIKEKDNPTIFKDWFNKIY